MDRNKKALIFGISGQDGAYLARLLTRKGYEVHGTSRDRETKTFHNLHRVGLNGKVHLHSASPLDFRSLFQVMSQIHPDEIYNLSGQSSVALSFQQPIETFESIALGTLNILECMRLLNLTARFFNAASSDSFGHSDDLITETSPMCPRSPYAMSKAAAFWTVANYREAYHLFACSGILFNHESPLRPARFVTRKIVTAAVRIANGSSERLLLGNLEIFRDWGWAPEYVEAMWRMLQHDVPTDFIVATGETHSLRMFVELAFHAVGLNWSDHVDIDHRLFRPTDLIKIRANPERIARELGWRATIKFHEIIHEMVRSERELQSGRLFELAE